MASERAEARIALGEKRAAAWNVSNPIGTPVRYWPVLGDPHHVESKTRSEAWVLGDGTPVVSIAGRSGGVHLGHLLTEDEYQAKPPRWDVLHKEVRRG